MKRHEILDAGTIEEAIHLLYRHGKEARLIAGGTDLLPKILDYKVHFKYLINILGIPGLDKIEMNSQNTLRLGALTPIQAISESNIIKKGWPVLAEAAEQIGSLQIRNIATLGGNLCNASPAADMAPPLIVLGAKAIYASRNGKKIIPVEDLFVDASKSALSNEEILLQIEIPPLPKRSGAVYLKFGVRKAMDIALAGVSIFMRLESERDYCQETRIAMGAVAPTPVRAQNAERHVKGMEIEDSLIQEAGLLASKEARPITDYRGSAGYRRELVRVLTIRGLRLSVARAQNCFK